MPRPLLVPALQLASHPVHAAQTGPPSCFCVAVHLRGLGFQGGPPSKIQNRRGVEQAERPQHSGAVAAIDVRGVGQRAPCQDLAQVRGHERGFLARGRRRPLVQPGMARGTAPGAVVVVCFPALPLPVDGQIAVAADDRGAVVRADPGDQQQALLAHGQGT